VRKTRTPRLAIEKLVDPEVKRNYQNQLVECLPDGTVSDINGHWEKISKALLKVGTSVCGTTQPTSFKHWISDRTVSLLETRRQIPPGRHHNSTRRIIRRQVKLSVRADREAWWTRKAQEMEDAKNAGNGFGGNSFLVRLQRIGVMIGGALMDGVPVTPPVLGWRRCKKWRLIDVIGVHAVSFFPDCLIERLEVLGQPGSIPAFVLPSGGMAVRHRKGATVERFFRFTFCRGRLWIARGAQPERVRYPDNAPSIYSASQLSIKPRQRVSALLKNFIINAQQAEFKRVPQCTTGRVYLLKVKNAKPFFVWMQEPNGKNDSNICSRINDYIASPPTQFTPPASDWLSNFGGFNQFSQNDLLALLTMGVGLGSGLSSESDVSSAQATAVTIGRHLNTGHLDSQTKPTTALGSAITTPQVTGPGSVPGVIPGKKGEGGKIQLQDLRNILSSISGPSKTSEPPIDLNDAVNMDSLRNLLEKAEVQARLLPHLPNRDPEAKPVSDLGNLTENIRSSQFKSTLKAFDSQVDSPVIELFAELSKILFIIQRDNRTQKSILASVIIIDIMTSVLNSDASLPYNHDLFKSLIVKKRTEVYGEETVLMTPVENDHVSEKRTINWMHSGRDWAMPASVTSDTLFSGSPSSNTVMISSGRNPAWLPLIHFSVRSLNFRKLMSEKTFGDTDTKLMP
ncbi:proteasomal ubiquitin receptor ADRM1, partial [Clonorchis sinensis]